MIAFRLTVWLPVQQRIRFVREDRILGALQDRAKESKQPSVPNGPDQLFRQLRSSFPDSYSHYAYKVGAKYQVRTSRDL